MSSPAREPTAAVSPPSSRKKNHQLLTAPKNLFEEETTSSTIPPGIQLLPITSKYVDSGACKGCTVKVGFDVACLLQDDNPEVGLRQGNVQSRVKKYSAADYLKQIHQFRDAPEQALEGFPALYVAHSVHEFATSGTAGPIADVRAALHPTTAGQFSGTEMCMTHLTIGEARLLLQTVQGTEYRDLPKGVDTDEPSYLVAWALTLLAKMSAADRYQRLLVFRKKQGATGLPLQVAIDGWTDAELIKQTRRLLNTLCSVRFSIVQGYLRGRTASYLCTDDPKSIGLQEHIGTVHDRAIARSHLVSQDYGVQLFVPPGPAQIGEVPEPFSAKSVIICKHVGVGKQGNLARATALSLFDHFLHHSVKESVFGIVNPWYLDGTEPNPYCSERVKTAMECFLPDNPEVVKPTWVGIMSELDKSVQRLLMYRILLLETVEERDAFLEHNVPGSYRTAVEARMQKRARRSNQEDWKTMAAFGSSTHTSVKQNCCFVAAVYAALFEHVHRTRPSLELFLKKWMADQKDDGSLARAGVPHGMQELAFMLIDKFYLPTHYLVMALNEDKTPITARDKRCVWRKFLRHVSVCDSLASLYSAGFQSFYVWGRNTGMAGLCSRLRHCAVEKEVLVSGTIENKPPNNCYTQKGVYRYPEVPASSFAPRFRLAKGGVAATLDQLVMELTSAGEWTDLLGEAVLAEQAVSTIGAAATPVQMAPALASASATATTAASEATGAGVAAVAMSVTEATATKYAAASATANREATSHDEGAPLRADQTCMDGINILLQAADFETADGKSMATAGRQVDQDGKEGDDPQVIVNAEERMAATVTRQHDNNDGKVNGMVDDAPLYENQDEEEQYHDADSTYYFSAEEAFEDTSTEGRATAAADNSNKNKANRDTSTEGENPTSVTVFERIIGMPKYSNLSREEIRWTEMQQAKNKAATIPEATTVAAVDTDDNLDDNETPGIVDAETQATLDSVFRSPVVADEAGEGGAPAATQENHSPPPVAAQENHGPPPVAAQENHGPPPAAAQENHGPPPGVEFSPPTEEEDDAFPDPNGADNGLDDSDDEDKEGTGFEIGGDEEEDNESEEEEEDAFPDPNGADNGLGDSDDEDKEGTGYETGGEDNESEEEEQEENEQKEVAAPPTGMADASEKVDSDNMQDDNEDDSDNNQEQDEVDNDNNEVQDNTTIEQLAKKAARRARIRQVRQSAKTAAIRAKKRKAQVSAKLKTHNKKRMLQLSKFIAESDAAFIKAAAPAWRKKLARTQAAELEKIAHG